MNNQGAIEWLDECARYFEKRQTKGEDSAYWSNVYNAENARKIADLIRSLPPVPTVKQGGAA